MIDRGARVGELGAGRDRSAEQNRAGERGGRQDGAESVATLGGHHASSAGFPRLTFPAQSGEETAQRPVDRAGAADRLLDLVHLLAPVQSADPGGAESREQ